MLARSWQSIPSLFCRRALSPVANKVRMFQNSAALLRQKKANRSERDTTDDVPTYNEDDFSEKHVDDEDYSDEEFKMSETMRSDIRESFSSRAMFALKADYLAAHAARDGEHVLASALRSVAETGKKQAQELLELTAEYEGMDPVTGNPAGDLLSDVKHLIEAEEHNVEGVYPNYVTKAQDEDRLDIADLWEDMSTVTEKNVALLRQAKEKMTVREYDGEDEELQRNTNE